jgi:murein DD-endopeptidase MepM/ murein hydrolase activator NlpD
MKTKFALVIVLILLNLVSYSQSSLIERNRELLIAMQKEIEKVYNEIHESLGHIGYTAVETTDNHGETVENERTEENIPVNSEITEASYPDIYPTNCEFRLASKYGYRIDPFTGRKAFHHGIDLAVPENTKVFSCGSGKVIEATYNRTNGNYVIIDHENGYKSYYGHLSSELVKYGDHVIKGQIIGLSGNTGMSTGPHIHYQLSFEGKTLDPLKIIH